MCACVEALLAVHMSIVQVYAGRASELSDCVYHCGAPIFHDGWVCCVLVPIAHAYISLTLFPACISPATGIGHAVSREPVTLMSFCAKKVVPKVNTDGLVQW